MKMVQFDLITGTKITIFFTGNITLSCSQEEGRQVVTVMDGLHNNGGWKVAGTYTAAINSILLARELG